MTATKRQAQSLVPSSVSRYISTPLLSSHLSLLSIQFNLHYYTTNPCSPTPAKMDDNSLNST
jgi:hypothetical protein